MPSQQPYWHRRLLHLLATLMKQQRHVRGTKTTYPRPDYRAEPTDQQAIAAEQTDEERAECGGAAEHGPHSFNTGAFCAGVGGQRDELYPHSQDDEERDAVAEAAYEQQYQPGVGDCGGLPDDPPELHPDAYEYGEPWGPE